MAASKNQPRFEAEDIERLFRALLPDGSPNPFGEINEALSQFAERFEEEVKETELYREGATGDRSSILRRTFGILFLQIFKTIRFFFGLLPQGRVILIIVAVIGLATTLLNDKPVTLDAIREAAKSTGIADFIDKILKELKSQVGEMATELRDVADVISVTIAQSAGRFENLEQLLAISQEGLRQAQSFHQNIVDPTVESAREQFALARQALDQAIVAISRSRGEATFGANALSNIDVFLTPILRSLPKELERIPDLAGKLVRFTT